MLVGDYCFLKRIDESVLLTCLVMRLYPYGFFLATGVPRKGYEPSVIRRSTRFVKETGLVHVAYRCDREAALNTALEAAIAASGRTATPVTTDDIEDASSFPVPIA